MITPDSIEAKYQRIQALIERMDAQSKCRDKPLTNRSGKVVKPATVQCGTVCRQKQNCKVTKGELRKVRSAFKGKSKREMAEAIKALIASKKAGQSSTRATYEVTEKPRKEKNIKRREKRFERSVEQSEKRTKAKIAPDLPETPAVRLGKPIHDRVTTPEEAIANGRAILGDLIGKMAAEYDNPIPSNYEKMKRKNRDEYYAERKLSTKAAYELKDLLQQKRDGGDNEVLRKKIEDKRDELDSTDERSYVLDNDYDFLHSDDGVIKYGDAVEVRNLISSHKITLEMLAKKKARSESGSKVSMVDLANQEKEEKRAKEAKEAIEKLERILPTREEKEIRTISSQVIQALIDNSSLSKEEAISAVNRIQIKGEPMSGTKDLIADFLRMTNGQCLETLHKIKVTTNERASASLEENSIKYNFHDIKALFHEMGHHVEFASHNYYEEVGVQFVRGRATGPIEQLSVLSPGSKYEADEVALPNHFLKPYVGKVYPGNTSEVVSMGLQALSHPKLLAELALKDPDHLALVIGMASQRVPGLGKKATKTDSAPVVTYFGLNPHPFRKPFW